MPPNLLNSQFDIKSIFTGNAENRAKVRDNVVIDSTWVKSRFMVADKDLDPDIVNIRYESIASLKFTNTGIGANIFVNPRPQFNPLTDPKAENLVMGYTTPNLNPQQRDTGMGEGYSRLIDDNQQTVFLEFGLPKFNSLIDFFFRAVDYTDSVLANTGRPSTYYNLGKMIGAGVGLIAFPILSVSVYVAKLALIAVGGTASLKFYYFNSKMGMYWGVVNTLVTQLVTEQGLLSPEFMDTGNNKDTTVNEIGIPTKLSQADVDALVEMIPDIISEKTNYIDVFAIVTKAQRAAMKQKAIIYKRMSEGALDEKGALAISKLPKLGPISKINQAISFGTYITDLNTIDETKGDTKPKKAKPPAPGGAKTSAPGFMPTEGFGTYAVKKDKANDTFVEHIKQAFDSSLRQGGAYAVFAVDYTGSTSESFSNSVTSINIGDKAKQIASKSRALSYDLSRGNMLGDNVIQDGINAIKDTLIGVAAGATYNLTNVLSSLTGNAYVEIPKRWDDSSMSFKQNTYTMQLVSPYNTFLAQLQNIYIPVCMLLAGVFPLATGKSSYTSPFLCTLYSRGIENIQLGMITSVSITRGTSNLAFDKKRHALALDVSFTVTDFSTLITSPVNSSVFSSLFNVSIEDDTPLGNYISVLGGRDIITSKYSTKRLPMRLSRTLMKLEQTFNPDRIGYLLGDSLVSSLGLLSSVRTLPTLLSN